MAEFSEMFSNIVIDTKIETSLEEQYLLSSKKTLNCSKEWIGTKEELIRKSRKIERFVRYLMDKHKSADLELFDDKE